MFHLEPLIWTVRAGEKFEKFGDDFSFVCTVVKSGPKACRIFAACGEMPRLEVRKFMQHLRSMGFEEITWERAKDVK